MQFDARTAKLLQPGHHIVVGGCPGLRLVASTSGKAWIYRYQRTDSDSMRQIKFGQWPSMGATEAAIKWQELKTLRETGVDPALSKKAARKPVVAYTVGDLVADYVKFDLSVNRQEIGANAVEVRLLRAIEQIAKTPAIEVTRRLAFDLIAGMIDTPVAAKSVRNELGAAWRLALNSGKIPEESPNHWPDILAGKLKSKGALRAGVHKGTDKRTLAESEIQTLLTVDFPLLADTVQDVLTFYLWTGTRGGEIVQMHDKQLTVEDGCLWWTIPKAITKNAKRSNAGDLRVPLIGRARAVAERRNGSGYIFASASKTGFSAQAGINSQVHFRQPYSNSRPDVVRTRLTVTHWSPHDLRRTVRTMLASIGCPNEIAESILGHVQPGVQGAYNRHQYDSERKDWLQRWSDRLESIVG